MSHFLHILLVAKTRIIFAKEFWTFSMHEESMDLSSGGFQTLRTCGTLSLLQYSCQPLVYPLKLFVFIEVQLAALDAPSKVVLWKKDKLS